MLGASFVIYQSKTNSGSILCRRSGELWTDTLLLIHRLILRWEVLSRNWQRVRESNAQESASLLGKINFLSCNLRQSAEIIFVMNCVERWPYGNPACSPNNRRSSQIHHSRSNEPIIVKAGNIAAAGRCGTSCTISLSPRPRLRVKAKVIRLPDGTTPRGYAVTVPCLKLQ
jgi:hypothetical protein